MIPEMTTLHFHKPGLQTLVQDLGRNGYQAFGVPVSGALDRTSAKIANWLVGNALDTPVLEITLLGPSVAITGDCQIALTGADLSARLDGQPAPRYETIAIQGEAVLSFGRAIAGCRAYLAISGEWDLKKWLNSYSAATHQDRAIVPDSRPHKDSLLFVRPRSPVEKRVYPENQRPDFPTSLRVRVLPGPEFEAFSPYAIGFFFSRGYRLTPNSNRMGFRLDAHLIDFRPDREVISSGIVPGTIQVTNAGQPIILMADAQTTGGYYRLANVISADLDRLAQLKPGDEVWFSLVKLEEAYKAMDVT